LLRIRTVDDRGVAVSDARVRIDGVLIDASTVVPVNPGPHEVRAQYAGRQVVLSIEPKPGVQDVVATLDLRTQVPTRPTPTSFYIVGTSALVGLAAFGVFGIASLVQAGELNVCSPYCQVSNRSPLEATEVGADVSLAVSAAAVLGAMVAYLVRPTVFKHLRLSGPGVAWTF
jgi:hypothetical protein